MITNINNLPEPLVKAVTRHPRKREPNCISVSELIQPPQIRALSVKHESEITEDASDRLWALLGTLLHGVLERNAQGLKDTITEEALETVILGWTVIGHYDLSEMVLDGESLTDWKLTSVWTAIDGVKPDWEAQLNCYAELIRRTGRKVSQLQIVAVFRDWSKSKARFDPQYPQQQVRVMPVRMWGTAEVARYLENRVQLHQDAAQGIQFDCTPAERWERPTSHALMKKGNKKAVRLMPSVDALAKYALENNLADHEGNLKAGYFMQERPGESVRCENYCSVSQFCRQWDRMKNGTQT